MAMTALRKTLLVEEEPVVATPAARAPATKLYVVAAKAPAEARAEATEPKGNAFVNIVLFLLAPFIGLAYIVAMPFVLLGVLAVMAARAAAKRAAVRTAGIALKRGAVATAAPLLGLAYIILFPVIGLAALAWIGGRAAIGAA
jgi:K+-transporting ATPase A subunit